MRGISFSPKRHDNRKFQSVIKSGNTSIDKNQSSVPIIMNRKVKLAKRNVLFKKNQLNIRSFNYSKYPSPAPLNSSRTTNSFKKPGLEPVSCKNDPFAFLSSGPIDSNKKLYNLELRKESKNRRALMVFFVYLKKWCERD